MDIMIYDYVFSFLKIYGRRGGAISRFIIHLPYGFRTTIGPELTQLVTDEHVLVVKI